MAMTADWKVEGRKASIARRNGGGCLRQTPFPGPVTTPMLVILRYLYSVRNTSLLKPTDGCVSDYYHLVNSHKIQFPS